MPGCPQVYHNIEDDDGPRLKEIMANYFVYLASGACALKRCLSHRLWWPCRIDLHPISLVAQPPLLTKEPQCKCMWTAHRHAGPNRLGILV